MTQENQAAAIVNNILGMVAQLASMQQQINAISSGWTNLSVASKINAFPTAPLTATGGLGTPDGTPVVANPINTLVAPGTQIGRAISANNIASMLTYLQGVALAIGGSAVSANGAAVQLLALAQ